MPRWITLTLVVLAALALVPLACIAKARTNLASPLPRVHLIQDMDNQPRFKSQQKNPLFLDGRASRTPVAGTVPRGQVAGDDHLARGLIGGEWATTFPMELTPAVLKRGQERYGVFCSPCHGLAGYGDGIVAKRADRLQEGTWVPPSSFHTEQVRNRPVGHVFNTITHGIRTMPAYGSQIPEGDRWAIVAYIRALDRSQNATLLDVPADRRSKLR